MNWQSSRVKPAKRSRATSQANATFEASVRRDTIDSPKKARPSDTPYNPPTSSSPSHTSMEWAKPCAWSWR